MIFIVAKFTVAPQHSDQWLDKVADFTAATRAEPGNLWFDWSRSVEDPNEFILLEAFADDEAGKAHVNSLHFTLATQTLPELLAKTPEIVNTTVPGSQWSELGEMRVSGTR